MEVVGRLDPDTGKVVEYPFPHAENSPRDFFMDDKGRIGCTARAVWLLSRSLVSEPDVRASHPALWIDLSEWQQQLP
jgi:streptogramin lyase